MARVSEIYGSMVFDEHTMQERLPSATYKQLMRTIKDGEPLDIDVANVVAHAMKEWAIELGATHYTHWFQPLTGITSEKHDSFIDPTGDGRAIMSFSGKELIRGESDASSFPNGGLRATFEARGYTAWDPTSYAFIKDEVLCIPTAFCSYTGEALDKKTPLLRSMKVIEEQAKRVLDLFGEHTDRVIATVGAEQECFLISEKDYEKRLDLVLTGRTLFGYPPCKGQELEQHYYGAIRPTVNEFRKELDEELWKLGVPAKTKHNEVAPAQHELAPIFSNANRAIDENLLTMEKMRLLASHHGLVCLQHEKPFEGINGSGKHDNWSLSTGKKNLFDPGENPMENLRFLVFLTAVIEAVDEYQELLRMSVASAGNDHRLGANEAPPAIVSMYLGDELGAVVDALIDDHEYTSAERVAVDLGVDVLPNFLKDNSARSRAHHLQRRRLLRRVDGRGGAPRAGDPSHHGRRASVLRRPQVDRAVRGHGRAVGDRGAKPLRGEAREVQQGHEHRDPHDEAPGASRLPSRYQQVRGRGGAPHRRGARGGPRHRAALSGGEVAQAAGRLDPHRRLAGAFARAALRVARSGRSAGAREHERARDHPGYGRSARGGR